MDFKEEVVGLEELAVDGVRRYENSIMSSLPNSLSEKGIVAVRTFLNFMDNDMISEYTGKKTYLNVEESYIMSGVYNDEHLDTVYKVVVKEVVEIDRKTDEERIVYDNHYTVIDKREDLRIRTEALRYWADNALENHFAEMLEVKRGRIPFQDLLKFAIETDALKEGDVQNRKMAIDIHGMKNKNNKQTINVYVDGGGNRLATSIAESSNNKFLGLGLDEDE